MKTVAHKHFIAWMRLRPLTSAALCFAAGMCAGGYGIWDEIHGGTSPGFFAGIGLIGITFATMFLLDWKKVVATTLCAMMVAAPVASAGPERTAPKDEFQPAGLAGAAAVGIGLGLLVGTAYIGYRAVRACAKAKKQLPCPTNAPPDQSSLSLPFRAADAGDTYGALVCWAFGGYCLSPFQPASEAPTQNAVKLRAVVEAQPGGEMGATIKSITHYKEDALVSFDDFQAGLATWGLTWTGATGDAQMTRNGQPITPDLAPFTISPQGIVTMYPERPQFMIVVEVSDKAGDDAQWKLLFKTSLPAGVPFEIEDTPEGEQAFYRVRVE